jgi:hypothetical protein
LAQAIQEATAMNPDFTVEKIEINQTTQDDWAPCAKASCWHSFQMALKKSRFGSFKLLSSIK